MVVRRLPTILPPLGLAEALELAVPVGGRLGADVGGGLHGAPLSRVEAADRPPGRATSEESLLARPPVWRPVILAETTRHGVLC